MQADTVIVGGGIGGLALAHALTRAGQSVIVIDRNEKPPDFARPEILWPATISWLKELLPPAAQAELQWLPIDGITLEDARGRWEIITPAGLQRAGIEPVSTHPAGTRRALWQNATFPLLGGHRFVRLERDGKGQVQGLVVEQAGIEKSISTRRVIADDGGQSPVRRAAGLDFPLQDFAFEFIIFAAKPFPEQPRHVQIWRSVDRFPGISGLGILPYNEHEANGLLLSPSTHTPEFAESWKAVRRSGIPHAACLPEDLAACSRYRPHWGHAPQYGEKGIALMGDAVHPVSPAGGQGANMSVADARVLNRTILKEGDRWIEAYETSRRPSNTRSLRFTRLARALQKAPNWIQSIDLVGWGTRLLVNSPRFQARMLRTAAQAFVTST
jgi:2-polyprenyl-6-methoxyphenol hydroxylase-like FAD-dependent oxidoreductase